MQKWMHTNVSDLTSVQDNGDRQLSDDWDQAVQLRRQSSTAFVDALDGAGANPAETFRDVDSSWPRVRSEPQPHHLFAIGNESDLFESRPHSLNELNLLAPPPPPPQWSPGSSGDSTDGTGFNDDDSTGFDAASTASTEEGEEEDSEFLFVPQGGSKQPELKSIQEILREGGSSSMYFSSNLPSNGRCLYPILEESSDEISDEVASDVDQDDAADAVFRPTAAVILPGVCQEEELKCKSTTSSRRSSSSSTSSSTSTYSDSSEASLDFDLRIPQAKQDLQSTEPPQQLQTVEDMRRWSLRLQPQQLDAIAEAESASTSSSASSDNEDEEPNVSGRNREILPDEETSIAKHGWNGLASSTSHDSPVRVVASSRAQVRDASGRLTGDEASAVTEATGATVGVAVARAAARAASIATSTVVRSGGAGGGASRYRILISTQCDVEHNPIHGTYGDVNDGWCQPIEEPENLSGLPEHVTEGEHILKLLPALDQGDTATSRPSIRTMITEEQLLVKSSEACITQPEASVESAYIVASSGDEESSSETDNDEADDSDNLQTSGSDTGSVQWSELHARAAAYRSVLQNQSNHHQQASDRPDAHNRLQLDKERLRRARETCLSGQQSLREQLLARGQYQTGLTERLDTFQRSKVKESRDGEQVSSGTTIGSQPLRKLLDDDLARKIHNPQHKLRSYRSTDLDSLDDLDIPHGGTFLSMLETQPGQFNSVSLFDLSRSALACNRLGNSFSPSLMETNIDTGEETYHTIVKETDVDTLQQLPAFQSPASVKRRSRSLLNLTGSVDSKDRELAVEVGVGNAISRSGSKRRSKKKKRKSFIERLEERATTDPEKEICRSLSRLKIPAWMDKMPLNGYSTVGVETRYSRYKAENSRASASVNDLAISEALNSAQTTNEVEDMEESTADLPVHEEGFLRPVILPTCVSLPCLLAVRPEETHQTSHVRQVNNEAQLHLANNDKPPAVAKTRSQLLKEGQEIRRQRLVDLQSRMQRPSLEPVTLTPDDFLPKTDRASSAPTRNLPMQTTSVRPKSLTLPGNSLVSTSLRKSASQSSASNRVPPQLPPRSTAEPVSSARIQAIALAKAAISEMSSKTARQMSTESRTVPPPPPPPRSSGVQALLGLEVASATDSAAIVAWKSNNLTEKQNATNDAPPPPPPQRSPGRQLDRARQEAIVSATAAIESLTKNAGTTANEIPPPPPRWRTAQFLSPDWRESRSENQHNGYKSRTKTIDQVQEIMPQKSSPKKNKRDNKSSSPQLDGNHRSDTPRVNGRDNHSPSRQATSRQSPTANLQTIVGQKTWQSSDSDQALEHLEDASLSQKIDRDRKNTPASTQAQKNGLDSSNNSGSRVSLTKISDSKDIHHPSPLRGEKSPLPKTFSVRNVPTQNGGEKPAASNSNGSVAQHLSNSDRADSTEESTVVQTSVVYRRIVRQTIEYSERPDTESKKNSSGTAVKPTTLNSVLSCQTEPEVVSVEALRGLIEFMDNQLGQYKESLAELELGGFRHVGKYAEMIAALDAAKNERLSDESPENAFEGDSVTEISVCHRLLINWLLQRPETHRRIAHLARASHPCLGRGCVLLLFAVIDDYEMSLLKPPVYAPVDELRESAAVSASSELIDACACYSPEDELVVCLAVGNARLWARIAASPQREQTPQPPPRERRQLFVSSLRRSLRDRGVSLRHHYPELHELLEAYTDTGEAFAPVTIRPVDAVSGRAFACSIAVPSTKDGEWWANDDLLGDHSASLKENFQTKWQHSLN